MEINPHESWHKFRKFLFKKFGKDLDEDDEYLLAEKLIGYEVIEEIEKYAKRNKEIRIVPCDDSHYAGSILVLIPHPTHGITIMFIPQCTSTQNQFFLYERHYKQLMIELIKLLGIHGD